MKLPKTSFTVTPEKCSKVLDPRWRWQGVPQDLASRMLIVGPANAKQFRSHPLSILNVLEEYDI